jgi:hypothetical protein
MRAATPTGYHDIPARPAECKSAASRLASFAVSFMLEDETDLNLKKA